MEKIFLDIYTSYKQNKLLKEEINEVLQLINNEIKEKENVYKREVLTIVIDNLKLKTQTNDESYIDYVYYVMQWYYYDYLCKEIPKQLYDAYNENSEHYSIATYLELREKGFTPTEVIVDMRKVTLSTMPDLPEELLGGVDIWAEKMEANPDRALLLMHRNRIIGYLSVDFLSKRNFKEVHKGNLDEDDLDVVIPMPGNLYNLYFNTITIFESYRNYKALAMLTDGFLDRLVYFAEKNIIIENLVANAYSQEGENLCRIFDMVHICDHNVDGKMYGIKMYPVDTTHNILKRYEKLIEIYLKHEKNNKKENILSKIFSK